MFTAKLFKHQEALINMVRLHKEIPYIFLIGGYGCGKSTTVVYLSLFLYHAYKLSQEPINIGLLGVTIKLLRQTVIKDLKSALDRGGIAYRDNVQQGILDVGNGNVRFIYMGMENPDTIFAHNFNCAICDELDELPTEKVRDVLKAIQERSRVMLPAGVDMPAREPFVAFTTTAQGLGGTYQLIKYLEERGLAYAVIRGRTEDNTSLAPSQIKLLRGLYTEEEAKAYLDGEFVNLTTGRVYPMFDERLHKYINIDIKPDEQLYVGQDFNAGYNAAVVVVDRGGKLFVVDEHHWDYVGHAAQLLRDLYPTNKITMIPDANGKEIMSGFVEEFEGHSVDIFWNNVNPSILERVTAINKGLMFNQLFVCEKCKKLLMGLETRDFDDAGKPRKGKGPNALDHHTDSLEYVVWRVIHSIKGYERILQAIAAVHHAEELRVQDLEDVA